MPDGPFKAMSPDPDSQRRKRELGTIPVETCERCGGPIFIGDWVWCKGRKEDHER